MADAATGRTINGFLVMSPAAPSKLIRRNEVFLSLFCFAHTS